MLDQLLSNVGQYVTTNPWLALLAVFSGGVLTASNPCVLAMIPLMIGIVAGRRESGMVRSFLYSLTFVSGLAITFTMMGMTAALAGRLYGDISGVWNWVVAVVCVVMGLHFSGVLNIPIPSIGDRLKPRKAGFFGAFLLGLLFGVVSAPCAAPILVVLLTYLAGANASVAWGGTLLLVYALGHSVLVIVAGTSMGAATKLIENTSASRVLEIMRRMAGVLIILVGLYFAWKGLN